MHTLMLESTLEQAIPLHSAFAKVGVTHLEIQYKAVSGTYGRRVPVYLLGLAEGSPINIKKSLGMTLQRLCHTKASRVNVLVRYV